MTMLASFDQGAETQIATNEGWGDLTRWALALEPGAYPDLQHLAVYGWSQELDAVAQELADALAQQAPEDASVTGTAQGLLAILQGRGEAQAMVISNGIGA
jgi:hypothetical protein